MNDYTVRFIGNGDKPDLIAAEFESGVQMVFESVFAYSEWANRRAELRKMDEIAMEMIFG